MLQFSKAEVEKVTQEWIREFIIRNKICPFAARSAFRVVVDTFEVDDLSDKIHNKWKLPSPPTCEVELRAYLGTFEHRLVLHAMERAKLQVQQLLEDYEKEKSSNLFIVYPAGLWEQASFGFIQGAIAQHCRLGNAALSN